MLCQSHVECHLTLYCSITVPRFDRCLAPLPQYPVAFLDAHCFQRRARQTHAGSSAVCQMVPSSAPLNQVATCNSIPSGRQRAKIDLGRLSGALIVDVAFTDASINLTNSRIILISKFPSIFVIFRSILISLFFLHNESQIFPCFTTRLKQRNTNLDSKL